MPYLNPRIAAAMDPKRVEALEKLFARLDECDRVIARARREAEEAGDDDLTRRVRTMHKRRAPVHVRKLLKD